MFKKDSEPSGQERAKKDWGFLCVMGILILLINILTFEKQNRLWVVAASIGLIVVIFILRKITRQKKPVTKANKVISVVMWLATPPLMFILLELIMGNLETIGRVYILKNLVIFYVLYLVFSLCFRRLAISAVVYCGVMMALAMTEYYVLLFRGRPFMIFDIWGIGTAAEVAGNYSYDIPEKVGYLLLVCLLLMVINYYLQKMELPKKRWMILIRLGGIALFAVYMVLILNTDLMRRYGAEEMIIWNMEMNYRERGSLYSLYSECQYICTEKPDGYSPDAVREIVEDTKGTAEDSAVVQPENLIVIMNESLADMERLGPIQTNTEILPYIKSMSQNTKKGWLQVPVVGGGTADTEYEVLTGNTKQFLPAGTSAYEFYCEDSVHGMTETLNEQGYHTMALHPANAGNWNRATVYRNMGFDEFISLENWNGELETIHGMVSDESVYEKLIEVVDNKEEGQKLFTFVVTIQNHGGYEKEIEEEISPVSLDYDVEYPQAENYFALLNESDRAFEELIRHFEKVKEPTMIVMFGDHLAGLPDGFYDVLEQWEKTEAKMTEMEMYQRLYQTPYVLWTNYDQESSDEEFLSTNYFGSYILQQAGLKLTSYDEFLLSLKEEIPNIGMGAICDKNGEWYLLDELPAEHAELIRKYKVLQYNNVMDRNHTCEEVFSVG